VGAETDADGRYVLVYDWSGMHIGEQMAQCRFRVMAIDIRRHAPFRGAAHRLGGVVGLDLRALISNITPLDAFAGGSDGASVWLNFIADQMRALPRASAAARGILADGLSTENYTVATRIDFRLRA
jgi:hypothetical protein